MPAQEFLNKIQNWDKYIDLELSEEENLLFQLNSDIHATYTLSDIEFSLPTVIDELIIPYDHPNNPVELNTSVIVKAKSTSRFNGQDIYKYRRINIVDQWNILNSQPIEIPKSLTTDTEIKRHILVYMPYRLDSFTIEKTENKILLKAIPNSLLYIGEFEFPYIETDNPISRIKRGKGIAGLDYHFHKRTLGLKGLDYHTTHTNVINSKGFTYRKVDTTVNSQGFSYKAPDASVINSKGFSYKD